MFFCIATLLAQPPAKAAAPEEEEGRPYIGRDYEGNRIFGTDDKSDAGFGRDPQTGDRTFKTAPPQKQEDQGGYSGPIWVSPEVTPGRSPSGWQRPPSGNPRPPR